MHPCPRPRCLKRRAYGELRAPGGLPGRARRGPVCPEAVARSTVTGLEIVAASIDERNSARGDRRFRYSPEAVTLARSADASAMRGEPVISSLPTYALLQLDPNEQSVAALPDLPLLEDRWSLD
jgi:hypothetical protein